jgi:hypothetical protein
MGARDGTARGGFGGSRARRQGLVGGVTWAVCVGGEGRGSAPPLSGTGREEAAGDNASNLSSRVVMVSHRHVAPRRANLPVAFCR